MRQPTVSQLKEELEQIKKYLNYAMSKISIFEARLKNLGQEEIPAEDLSIPQEKPVFVEKKETVSSPKDIEANVGKFWLNRIGIAIFTLGIAFLVSYAFKYFGPLAKIASSLAIGAGLFLTGSILIKKEKFINYGRVLLGGAWAITYFTTYAMHHFEASRIINSQFLGLLLLGAVSVGIIAHALKYKSEELFAIAVFVGYITATIGDINYFTFISCSLLALTIVFLVYRFQWIRLIILGIFCTYSVHFFWVFRHIYNSPVSAGTNSAQFYFFVNAGFLSLYWIIFMSGVHLLQAKGPAVKNKLSAANFMNFLLFFLMVYPELSRLYPANRFYFFFALGCIYLSVALIMERFKRKNLSSSDIIIALLLLTLAVPLKFLPFSTNLIWLVELPFLMYVGLVFDRKELRYFGLGLAIWLYIKITMLDFDNLYMPNIFGYAISWDKVISFCAFLSMSATYYILKFTKTARSFKFLPREQGLSHILSALAVIYLGIFLFFAVDPKWITFSLILEALILSSLGLFIPERSLRIYSFCVSLIVFFRILIFDNSNLLRFSAKWPLLITEIAALYANYFLYKSAKIKGLLAQYEETFLNLLFWLVTIIFTWVIYLYSAQQWITLGLGIEGIVLFSGGFILKDRVFRIAGFIIFALTLLRIIFVDLSMLAVIYKIASFIILGLIFLGVSFIYNKYNIGKSEN
ncbi:MAG: DUF2339 domain-containing protein [Candidatus Omnitrophota bacterium]